MSGFPKASVEASAAMTMTKSTRAEESQIKVAPEANQGNDSSECLKNVAENTGDDVSEISTANRPAKNPIDVQLVCEKTWNQSESAGKTNISLELSCCEGNSGSKYSKSFDKTISEKFCEDSDKELILDEGEGGESVDNSKVPDLSGVEILGDSKKVLELSSTNDNEEAPIELDLSFKVTKTMKIGGGNISSTAIPSLMTEELRCKNINVQQYPAERTTEKNKTTEDSVHAEISLVQSEENKSFKNKLEINEPEKKKTIVNAETDSKQTETNNGKMDKIVQLEAPNIAREKSASSPVSIESVQHVSVPEKEKPDSESSEKLNEGSVITILHEGKQRVVIDKTASSIQSVPNYDDDQNSNSLPTTTEAAVESVSVNVALLMNICPEQDGNYSNGKPGKAIDLNKFAVETPITNRNTHLSSAAEKLSAELPEELDSQEESSLVIDEDEEEKASKIDNSLPLEVTNDFKQTCVENSQNFNTDGNENVTDTKMEQHNEKSETMDNEQVDDPVGLTPIGFRDDAEEEPDNEAESSAAIIELLDDEEEEESRMETSQVICDGIAQAVASIQNDGSAAKVKLIATNTDATEAFPYPIFRKKDCVNFACKRECNRFLRAPGFVVNLYQMPRKVSKVQFVCDDCYDGAVKKYEEACSALRDDFPLENLVSERHDFVEILDSSDEEDGESTIKCKDFSSEILNLFEKHLETTLEEVLNTLDINKQLSYTYSSLKDKLTAMDAENNDITVKLNILQKSADSISTRLYQCPKIKIKELIPLDLNTGRPYVNDTEFTIPPVGEIRYPSIEMNGNYFAVKNKAIASWWPCKIIEMMDVVGPSGQKPIKHFKIRFINVKQPTIKCVSSKHMAYGEAPKVRLPIGSRVLALFDAATLTKGKEKVPTNVRSAFYPGIVAEQLQAYNRYRYLIFFDDGYAQYVKHPDVRMVCHVAENVWEDVHPGSREFIHNYLTEYQKHRPMVQVRKGQNMMAESNGKWLFSKVIDVDASLVQLHFVEQNSSEWIYRGSTRLGPLFKERQNASNLAQQVSRTGRTEPFVRYMQDDETNKAAEAAARADQQARAVAKKSTTQRELQQQQQQATTTTAAPSAAATMTMAATTSRSSSTGPVKHLNNSTIFLEDDNKPKGKVVYYTAKKSMPPKRFESHECRPGCLFPVTHNLNSYSPLAKPLLSGWEREIIKSKLKKSVVYRAPCGRRMRNMDELHKYLRATKNTLNVENFDFDCLIHCLAEYVIESSIVSKVDISDGVENMAVPCVNYYDNSMPPDLIYSAHRIPTEGVNLNLDSEFLVGCDCEDDCSDKSKCSCWQLTLEGARFGNPSTSPENVGYTFKRLPDTVPTAIYECNSKCKCTKQCLNRVVQHPLQTKLQVFKTSNRGWGLRCLNDVPKGSFVCIYAGLLLNEQNANEGGANFGDEYFAELDYIEVVERLKEGYESDAQEDPESEEEEEENYEPGGENDSDEEFTTFAEVHAKRPINTRLRARKGTKDFDGETENAEDDEREVLDFEARTSMDNNEENSSTQKYRSLRKFYGKNEYCYVMDAKKTGNIGRYFNHSCSPNLFVQNVFVDTHDPRFPWVAFFALSHIRAGTELTWNYNYEVGIVPGKVLYCECGAPNCRGRLL